MKKIYTFALSILAICSVASAQFQKGQTVIGGSIGFSIRDVDQKPVQYYDNKYTDVIVMPSIGWFTSARQLVGFAGGYGRSSNTTTSNLSPSEQKSIDESASAYVFSQRFFPIAQRFYFTLKGSAGGSYLFGKSTSSSTGYNAESKSRGFEVKLALAPGLSYQVNQKFLFDISLNDLAYAAYNRKKYKSVSPTDDNQSTEQNFTISSSLNTNLSTVGLGFRWVIQ